MHMRRERQARYAHQVSKLSVQRTLTLVQVRHFLLLAKQPREQHVLGPHHAVDGAVGVVAQRAHREALGQRLGLALEALTVALHMYRHLRRRGQTS